MTRRFDITAIGHAIVDVQASSDEAFLAKHDLHKGAMTLVDQHRSARLFEAMTDTEMASGGSAGNTIAGKVAHDTLGEVFNVDMQKQGVHFKTPFLHNDPTHTGCCMINVTRDGQRTMATYLGAAALVGPEDIDEDVIKDSQIVYLEGYLFDTPSGREAFAKATDIARQNGVKTAITLSC
jgi:sugar/nucleoside kinase (ribokinase family)